MVGWCRFPWTFRTAYAVLLPPKLHPYQPRSFLLPERTFTLSHSFNYIALNAFPSQHLLINLSFIRLHAWYWSQLCHCSIEHDPLWANKNLIESLIWCLELWIMVTLGNRHLKIEKGNLGTAAITKPVWPNTSLARNFSMPTEFILAKSYGRLQGAAFPTKMTLPRTWIPRWFVCILYGISLFWYKTLIISTKPQCQTKWTKQWVIIFT